MDVISTIYDTAVSVWAWLLDHIIFVNLILSIIIVFFRRHDPKTVWTWLLALYFIPVFGILFYLFFDQDFRKSKMFRIKEVEDRLRYSARNQEEFIKSQDMGLLGSLAGGYADLVGVVPAPRRGKTLNRHHTEKRSYFLEVLSEHVPGGSEQFQIRHRRIPHRRPGGAGRPVSLPALDFD